MEDLVPSEKSVAEQVGSVLSELVCKIVRLEGEWCMDHLGGEQGARQRVQHQKQQQHRQQKKQKQRKRQQRQQRQERQQRRGRSSRCSDESGIWIKRSNKHLRMHDEVTVDTVVVEPPPRSWQQYTHWLSCN